MFWWMCFGARGTERCPFFSCFSGGVKGGSGIGFLLSAVALNGFLCLALSTSTSGGDQEDRLTWIPLQADHSLNLWSIMKNLLAKRAFQDPCAGEGLTLGP